MNLRAAMPVTAAFIDDLRAAFGAAAINAEIRKGMAGLPGHFHARENGHEAGTPFIERGSRASLAEIDITQAPPAAPARGRK